MRVARKELDLSMLRSLVRYAPDTGRLFWLPRGSPAFDARYAHKEAFVSTDDKGYRRGGLLGKVYLAHRVIWALMTSSWPSDEIDHKNRVRADNRWENLREATRPENMQNQTKQRRKNGKYKGVN